MGINKNGIVSTNNFSEIPNLIYDKTIYTEPDGSKWIRIFHHNNPANALFNNTNKFIDKVYLDADRWFHVSLCNLIDSDWELMIKQKTVSTNSESKYRWIQKTNPMQGTYEDVAPSSTNITRVTTTGYSTSTSAGGIYLFNSSTYLIIANGNKGNWFGAIGSWSSYQSGIPGYPTTAITSGYMDLYLRIPSEKCNIQNNKISAENFYEI